MKKGILITISIGLALAGAYYIYKNLKPELKTKAQAVDYLMKKEGRDRAKLEALGEDFLLAWAEATRDGKPEFYLNAKTYLTETGKAK